MPVALGGRLVSGFGGGALIALAMVAIQRYFPSSIWPQLMAILSVVWGVTAFGGPLFGGIVVQSLDWRSGFLIFAGLAVAFASPAWWCCGRRPRQSVEEARRAGFPSRRSWRWRSASP